MHSQDYYVTITRGIYLYREIERSQGLTNSIHNTSLQLERWGEEGQCGEECGVGVAHGSDEVGG